eukprot:TRINITY_DN34421_c0_g1_i1.p1 TRINITY_DN34421_c0_g1~~TRINITY_DN34421_c0_g1_i1.p1  ORF type:complete len:656 (+),score=162.50 TRINITY_DN34421_c0_g1_i1:54-1970(+)
MAEPQPVENWLLSAGEGYKEHAQKLKAERLKEELGKLRDKPLITEYARGLKRGGVPVEDRLCKVPERPERKEEKFPFEPRINESSKYKQPKYNNEQWQQAAKDRILELQREKANREQQEVKTAPAINNTSEGVRDRTQGMELHDYLLVNEKQRQATLYDKFEERHASESHGMQEKPTISNYAASLRPDRDVVDRLYGQQPSSSYVSPLTVSAPTVRSSSAEKSHTVFDRLQHHKTRAEVRKESATRERSASITSLAKQSHVSKASAIILSGMADRSSNTHKGRLSHQNPNHPMHSKRDDSRGDFIPSQNTKKMTRAELSSMYNRWEQAGKKKQQETERTRKRLQQEEKRECYFDPKATPALTRSRSAPFSQAHEVSHGYTDLATKGLGWIARREHRLSKLKHVHDKEELEFCTFRPYVNQEIPISGVDTTRLKGYSEYVNRMRKARMVKREEEVRECDVFKSGSKWTGRSTVPRDPMLGVSCNTTVASLSPPVNPHKVYPAPVERRQGSLDRMQQHTQHKVRQAHDEHTREHAAYQKALQEYYSSPEYREWYNSSMDYYNYYGGSQQAYSRSPSQSGHGSVELPYQFHQQVGQPVPTHRHTAHAQYAAPQQQFSEDDSDVTDADGVDPPPDYTSSDDS